MTIDSVLAPLGRWARQWSAKDPFTDAYGVSRTLLAIATGCTVAFNPPALLFSLVAGVYEVPRCSAGMLFPSVFCLVAPPRLEALRWLVVAGLAVVASGWRPRVTAIPHAWLSYSVFASSTIFDGGDQITLVLTVLLLPVALLDPRRWHWSNVSALTSSAPPARLTAWSAIFMIRLQVAAVYLVAGLSKLAQPEWANGTAMYYWLLTFGGAPQWVVALVAKPLVVASLTWGALALELALAAGIILGREAWRPLLISGIVFHIVIAFFFGLTTFSLAMIAALILYLHPVEERLLSRSSAEMLRRQVNALFAFQFHWGVKTARPASPEKALNELPRTSELP